MCCDNRVFYLWGSILQRASKGQNHIPVCKYLVVEIAMSDYLVDVFVVRVKFVVRKFILHPQKNENGTGHPDGQSKEIG
jgi:hypothetical protein